MGLSIPVCVFTMRANYCYVVVVVVYDEHEWTRFGQFGEFGGRERDNRK